MTDIYVSSPVGSPQVVQWMGEAISHFQANRLQEADTLCRRMAEAEPGNAEVFNLWAAVVLQGEDPDSAALLLTRAIALNGGQREYHHNLGNVLRGLGRFDEAVAAFQAALRLAPQAVDSGFELGLTLLDLDRPIEAAPCFKAVVTAAPGITDGYFRLGVSQLRTGYNQDAITTFRHALACQSDLSDAHTNLAIMLREEGDIEAALRSFRHSVVLRPDDPFILSNLGKTLKELDQEEALNQLLERAVLLSPNNGEVHYSLATGNTYSRDDWRLGALEALAEKLPMLDRDGQIYVHFALAKAYEDIGELEKSFQHQEVGNGLKRAGNAYDEAAYLRGVRRIKDAFTPELIARLGGKGDPSEVPIFVLGMPRSGSTLTEQILASHPSAFGAGELPNLPLLARALGPDSGPYFPEFLSSMGEGDIKALGAAYVEGLRAMAPTAARIVDKLPENYRLLGLIHCALPGAKIIHTRRDAVDTCLSIYSKLFSADVPYSYKLDEIGRYWRAYDDLMAHWRTILPPGSFYDLDYEKLVADQEGETRKLLDFCGLEWNEAVLQFHKTKRVVRTASARQIRKPLYSSSVGRWRPSAERLKPLLTELAGR
jgi:tetratricopeptide (TPR) repeat protein